MKDASADGEQGEAGVGSSPTLSLAEDAGASGPKPQAAPQRRTTEAGAQRAVSSSEVQGSGRGAKPSCGLVHLNKAFIELHFAEQGLPQTVWVQVNVDGRDFSVRVPGQVRWGDNSRAAAPAPLWQGSLRKLACSSCCWQHVCCYTVLVVASQVVVAQRNHSSAAASKLVGGCG